MSTDIGPSQVNPWITIARDSSLSAIALGLALKIFERRRVDAGVYKNKKKYALDLGGYRAITRIRFYSPRTQNSNVT